MALRSMLALATSLPALPECFIYFPHKSFDLHLAPGSDEALIMLGHPDGGHAANRASKSEMDVCFKTSDKPIKASVSKQLYLCQEVRDAVLMGRMYFFMNCRY